MKIRIFFPALALAAFFACNTKTTETEQTGDTGAEAAPELRSAINRLSADEKAAGWELLFDGQSTDGWHSYLKDEVDGWEVKDGILSTPGGKGDILTDEEYENFDLMFDFKVAPKGNSGVIYLVVEDEKYSAPYLTGPEYQIIDDENYPDPITPKQQTGANYDVHEPMTKAALPAGEWNTGRIIVDGGRVEHWLNGKKVVEYELGSPEWETAIAGSKWAQEADYGQAKKGKIDFQDHGDAVAFRNVKIREL